MTSSGLMGVQAFKLRPDSASLIYASALNNVLRGSKPLLDIATSGLLQTPTIGPGSIYIEEKFTSGPYYSDKELHRPSPDGFLFLTNPSRLAFETTRRNRNLRSQRPYLRVVSRPRKWPALRERTCVLFPAGPQNFVQDNRTTWGVEGRYWGGKDFLLFSSFCVSALNSIVSIGLSEALINMDFYPLKFAFLRFCLEFDRFQTTIFKTSVHLPHPHDGHEQMNPRDLI